jgi:hypothetical protein
MKPLCIDLFCGYGGWARGFLDAGYRVIGFDIEPRCAKRYPGEFVLADVRTLDGRRFRGARVIVASPPCQKFSTVNAKYRDSEQGMVLVREAIRVIREAESVQWCIENVRGAFSSISKELGPPMNRGAMSNASIYLWGKVAPTIYPRVRKGWKRQPGPPSTFTTTEPPSRDSWENSRIPYSLARALAEACLP